MAHPSNTNSVPVRRVAALPPQHSRADTMRGCVHPLAPPCHPTRVSSFPHACPAPAASPCP